MIFGVFVTFLCFVMYSAASYWVLQTFDMTMTQYYNPLDPTADSISMPVELSTMHLLLFTALLCSSDVVAAVSIVDYDAQPKLYSCIFGEGCFNDIVSIVLFNTVEVLQTESFTAVTPFKILAEFISLAVVSVAIGMIFGFLTCLMFKHFRFLSVSVVNETFIMTAFGFIAYFTASLVIILGLEMSGIIALLVFAII